MRIVQYKCDIVQDKCGIVQYKCGIVQDKCGTVQTNARVPRRNRAQVWAKLCTCDQKRESW